MSEKLLTIKEISSYLNMSEGQIRKLVDEGVMPAYRIGGSFLRFRKEQIDAIKDEIAQISLMPLKYKLPEKKDDGKMTPETCYVAKQDIEESKESISDVIYDFFYFNDFYIICAAIIGFILFMIFKI